MVVVPNDDRDAELCMLGRVMAGAWRTHTQEIRVRDAGYSLFEQPFPTFIA